MIITIPNGATYSSLKIYRSADKDALFDSVPIYNGVGVAEFTDPAPTQGTNSLMYIGVEMDKPEWARPVRSIEIAYFDRTNWGPLQSTVAERIARSGTPYLFGGGNFGALVQQILGTDPLYPDSAVPNLAALLSGAGTLYSRAYVVSPVPAKWLNVYDGKIILIRQNFSLTTIANATEIQFGEDLTKLANYLDGLTDGSNVYNFNGHNWRLKVATKAMVEKDINSWLISAAARPIRKTFMNIWSTASRVSLPSGLNDGKYYVLRTNLPDAPIAEASSVMAIQWGILYFEYVD